jgi:protein TonB
MNNLCDFSQSRRSRFAQAILWAVAAAMTLSVHAGAAIYMMQPVAPLDAEDGPPPAIMIEMAALPEAVNVDDTTETNDAVDSAEVNSDTACHRRSEAT